MNAPQPTLWPVLQRINVGCGYDKRPGYLNIDMDPACAPDLLIVDGDVSAITRGHYDEVCAKDVLEHIPRTETLSALLDWASWLKVGGQLWLQTSSILHVADRLRESAKYEAHHGWTICLFGNQAHGGDFHHTGFTETTLRVHLLAAGFEAGAIELIDGWMFRVIARKASAWDGFLRRHGNNDDDEWFVQDLFLEAFGREPDWQGRTHMMAELEAGRMTRREAAKYIFRSPERLLATAALHGL